MKALKYLGLMVVAAVMTACGGHGYEGEFAFKTGNDLADQIMKAAAGPGNLVIGADFIEKNGTRTKFEKIFVRKSGSQEYLVFKNGTSEEGWLIVDKDTLVQDAGLVRLTLSRVK
jgi:hypothetical protein